MLTDISPMRQGQTYPNAHWFFVDTLGSVVPVPTGTTLTLYIYNMETNVTLTGAGTWNTVNAALGQFDYLWNATDSATVGTYEVYAGFVMPDGRQGFTKPVGWTVTPLTLQQ